MRHIPRAATAVLAAFALLGFAVPSAAAGAPASASHRVRTVTAPAFDTCEAPSAATMNAWRASPYKAVGIYVGGANRACSNTGLTDDWVQEVHAQGWDSLPIYVGSQAPCTPLKKATRIDPARASDMGKAEADDAVDRAAALGFAEGSAAYLDMEAYDSTDAACRLAVLDFVSAWTTRLHERGYTAGYYSSLDSGIADIVRAAGTRVVPDALWYARWDGLAVTSGDGALPDDQWLARRVHQYAGNVTETYGGVTVTIDRNALEGPVGVL